MTFKKSFLFISILFCVSRIGAMEDPDKDFKKGEVERLFVERLFKAFYDGDQERIGELINKPRDKIEVDEFRCEIKKTLNSKKIFEVKRFVNQFAYITGEGAMSLRMAVWFNLSELVKFLILEKETDDDRCDYVDRCDCEGKRALQCSMLSHVDIEIARILIENGSDVNLQDNNGKTALFNAVEENNIKALKLLTDNKANVNFANVGRDPFYSYGFTALHVAAENGYLDCLKILIANGATVDAMDENDNTALNLAARNFHLHCFNFLVENKAEVDKIDLQETMRSAIFCAKSKNGLPIIIFNKG